MSVTEATDTDLASEVLAWSRALVDPAMRAAVDTMPADMRHVAGYHLAWWDEHGNPIRSAGGKALRSALVLLTAEAAGGTAADAVPAAVAVELVHNFSLLHDDIMDNDATRRHRPTAWRVFGTSSAILAGDSMLSLASGTLVESGHPAALSAVKHVNRAVQQLIHGQVLDIAFEQRGDVDLDQCTDMAKAKTGGLLGCACSLGAAFGRGSTGRVTALRSFGEHLGLAFQHTDDLLGIWGDPDVTGKPAFSDLRSRKKSLPVVAALCSDTPAGRELATRYYRQDDLSEEGLTDTADLVEAAGGREWSRAQAAEQLELARRSLRTAHPVARTEELTALAHVMTHRDR